MNDNLKTIYERGFKDGMNLFYEYMLKSKLKNLEENYYGFQQAIHNPSSEFYQNIEIQKEDELESLDFIYMMIDEIVDIVAPYTYYDEKTGYYSLRENAPLEVKEAFRQLSNLTKEEIEEELC